MGGWHWRTGLRGAQGASTVLVRDVKLQRETQVRVYETEAAFEKDRRKRVRDGWMVMERDMVPGARWKWASALSGEGVILLPLWVVGWLIFRKAPEWEIRVRYEREVRGMGG